MAHLEPKDIPCGPFRLVELLGRGGMGAVYLADRVDGEVKQRVAIKLLRPGGGDPKQRERFLAERQILATLSYPPRHWLPVAAASLAIAGLSTGLAVAYHERGIAQRRFTEVRQLANKLFDIDAEARKITGNTKTRQLIVDTSLEYLRRLSADAHGDPQLALEIGNAYMRVARVQGVPISLGAKPSNR